MKNIKLILIALLLAASTLFTACPGSNPSGEDGYLDYNAEIDYVIIDGSKLSDWNNWAFATVSINEFANKTVTAKMSAKIKVESKATEATTICYQINTGLETYPSIIEVEYEPGTTESTLVEGTTEEEIKLGNNPLFYISTYQLDYKLYRFEVRDFELTVTDGNKTVVYKSFNTGDAVSEVFKPSGEEKVSWLDDEIPSLYETYKDTFDYFGIACEYEPELKYAEIQNGLKKHANTLTTGNELKPDFIFNWGLNGNNLVDFKASNGKTIKVPKTLNGLDARVKPVLEACKKTGIQMRGHVLVWHSQTPDNFFATNYTATKNGDSITNLVSKEEMTARQEWYIKTVLEYVANWEAKNGYGEGNHIIWAWDVVNEAVADDAYKGSSNNWLRGTTASTKDVGPGSGGSRWAQVYGSDEFIVNAFRFANAYAPADVKLCYNDYNEYMNHDGGRKVNGISKLIDDVKNGSEQTINGKAVKPRIDVMGMQSHVGTSWPTVGDYESALKTYLKKGLDVHVTEFDVSAQTKQSAASTYSDYFKMLQKYGNGYSGSNKITCVTVWGINNESSWINPSSAGGAKTFPLMFNLINKVNGNKKNVVYNTGNAVLPQYDVGDSYTPNDTFWAVIKAHK